MTDDTTRHDATGPDDHTLTIDDAILRYEHAGHPRTARSIQRYCLKGHLDCRRQETPFGDKYLITPASVARHIAQIDEIATATGRDVSRRDDPGVAAAATASLQETATATSRDLARPAAADERYLTLLESENAFLKTQVAAKDTQIAALLERDHETNALINGLQRMLAPLLSAPDAARADSTPRSDESNRG